MMNEKSEEIACCAVVLAAFWMVEI